MSSETGGETEVKGPGRAALLPSSPDWDETMNLRS